MADLPPCPYPEKHSETYWRLESEHYKLNPRYQCGICHPYPWTMARACWLDTREMGFEAAEGRVVVRVGGWAADVSTPSYEPVSTSKFTKSDATKIIESWKAEEAGWVKARIVTLARLHGEYHVEAFEGIEVPNPGVAVQSLSRAGVVEKLNRRGDIEQRKGAYVWRLSSNGRAVAAALRKTLGSDALPGPKRANVVSGDISKDGRTVQGTLE